MAVVKAGLGKVEEMILSYATKDEEKKEEKDETELV